MINFTHQVLTEESRVLVPFVFATFSQPHSLLSCHPHTQKLELSCYDIVLKGASIDHPVIGKGSHTVCYCDCDLLFGETQKVTATKWVQKPFELQCFLVAAKIAHFK